MEKKYIFFDLDGTLIDHSQNQVSEKTKETIQQLKENGHEVFIATGRPPSLFYGIDKQLGINSFIAANGGLVVFNGELINKRPIEPELVNRVATYAYDNKIDVGFESFTDYVVSSNFTNLAEKFSDSFHLHYPKVIKGYHLNNEIYQMVMFYTGTDYKKFEKMFPGLLFNYASEYGLDVNLIEGLKDRGVRVIKEHLNISIDDIICVGDGFNDISMIEYAGLGIAMGNAKDEVKNSADIVADHISNDGLYKVFKELKMI